MKRIVVASSRKSAGKTSLVLGMARAMGGSVGYMKPLGDRLLYRKKRLWDYDAALVTRLLDLGHAEDEITIGFERVKLRYMYDRDTTARKVLDIAARTGEGKDVLLIEAGADLSAGSSVFLDPIELARTLDASLVVLVTGTVDSVVDDVAFIKRHVNLSGVRLDGVVFNKIPDVADFKDTQVADVTALGVDVLGVLPYKEELTHASIRFLADVLFARVIAGEGGLDKVARHILVAAMSTESALRDPVFHKPEKLIITSGDRSDLVLAALDTNTSAIVLANNILPPPIIVAKATERNIPVLLVPTDTFKTAKQIDDMEALLTREETGKLDLLASLASRHVDVARLMAP